MFSYSMVQRNIKGPENSDTKERAQEDALVRSKVIKDVGCEEIRNRTYLAFMISSVVVA